MQKSSKSFSDSKSQNKELNIEYMNISVLKIYKRNAKIHSEKQIAKIVESIKTFGIVTPIIADKNHEIIAGHGRLEALKQLGYKKVPVIMLEHLTDAQAKAYRLADNRIAEDAEYDKDVLKIELQELSLSNEITITDTGFDIAEIDEIVIENYGIEKETQDEADGIDNLSEIEERVKLGDIWELGEHLLICGDALKTESYNQLLQGEKAKLALVDAPYNVPINGHVCGKGRVKHREFAMASGEMSTEDFEKFVNTFMTNLVEFSIDGSMHYLFIDWRGLQIFLNAGEKNYSLLKNICIWNKLHGGMGSLYRSQYEAVCVFKNGTAPHINNVELGRHKRYRTNIWNHRGVSATNPKSLELLKFHPTVKPIGLLHEILLDVTCVGNIVLDCFGGSGSTLLACERAKRKARLIEISPHYCDVILYRWEKLSGKKAKFIKNVGDILDGE
jgi:DNA modification methylase